MNIQDNTITKIDHLNRGLKIFEVPAGAKSMRECSNPYPHDGKVYFMGTCDYKEDKWKFLLHYWVCDYIKYPDLDHWDYKGKITILDGNDNEVMAEDASVWFENGKWRMHFENKSYEKAHKEYVISYAVGGSKMSDTFYFQGGTTGLSKFGNGYAKKAVYSPHKPIERSDIMYLGGRAKNDLQNEELPGFARWSNGKWNPSPQPVMLGEPYNYQVLDFASDIWTVRSKRVGVIGGLRNWKLETHFKRPAPHYFCNGIAQGNTLTTGWEIITEEIRDENGKIISCHFFYLEEIGWRSISISNGTKAYLSTIVTGSSQPEPNGGSMKLVIEISGNNLIVNQAVPNTTKYEWQYSKEPGHYLWIGSSLPAEAVDIEEKYQVEGYEFWCYAMVDGKRTSDSNRVIYKSATSDPEPTNNAEYVKAIKAALVKIDNSQSVIYNSQKIIHNNLDKIE